MDKKQILDYLRKVKPLYEDGFVILELFGSYARNEENKDSDIDILYEINPNFMQTYGFKCISKIEEVRKSFEREFGKRVDLVARSGLGKTGYEYIVKRTMYV